MKPRVKFSGIFWIVAGLALSFQLSYSPAYAVQPDIGMVIRLTGTVTYWHEGEEQSPQTVQTFMKVRRNDYFDLSAHGVVQLVYFSNGRRETWTGPGAFKVGENRSEAVGKPGQSEAPQVISLPTAVVDEVKRVSPLVDPSKLHRSGGSQVRGNGNAQDTAPLPPLELTEEEKAEVAKARQVYNSIIDKVDPEDIMPELYFFSVLADYDQFDEMQKLLGTMRKKQPENAGIDRLEEWMNEQRGM